MTDMLYYTYEGNFLMKCDAEITQCVFLDEPSNDNSSNNTNSAHDDKRTVQLALNRTVLHAQGGGQPTDVGTIETPHTTIHVTKILLDRQTWIVKPKLPHTLAQSMPMLLLPLATRSRY